MAPMKALTPQDIIWYHQHGIPLPPCGPHDDQSTSGPEATAPGWEDEGTELFTAVDVPPPQMPSIASAMAMPGMPFPPAGVNAMARYMAPPLHPGAPMPGPTPSPLTMPMLQPSYEAYNYGSSQMIPYFMAPPIFNLGNGPVPSRLHEAAIGGPRHTDMLSTRLQQSVNAEMISANQVEVAPSPHFKADTFIKPEPDLTEFPGLLPTDAPYLPGYGHHSPSATIEAEQTDGVVTPTGIDKMMKVVQQRNGHSTKILKGNSRPDSKDKNSTRRKYTCKHPNCGKVFYQKTHLDIHSRSHTGDKPFVCQFCHERFTQMGNLKTHLRRHTGEKPFECPKCQKRFAQRGNVRAHMLTHSDEKPFECRLDGCNKRFTQLGNLKSHQNKFHAQTIKWLQARFDQNLLTPDEQELHSYFVALYKNCNKGIKGRGKNRGVARVVVVAAPAPAPEVEEPQFPKPDERRDSMLAQTEEQQLGFVPQGLQAPQGFDYLNFEGYEGYPPMPFDPNFQGQL